jgi:uncharacterized protein YbcV (DUF1398 family)
MDAQLRTIAENCKNGAEDNTMTFPQIVGTLMKAGFESYIVDFRRQSATYYRPDGESVEFKTHEIAVPVAAALDAEAKSAGCAGYMVSISGKRALYFGRTGETHVEYFPGSR